MSVVELPKITEIIIPVSLKEFSSGRLTVDIAIFNAYVSGISLNDLYCDLIPYCLFKRNKSINSTEYKYNCYVASIQYNLFDLHLIREHLVGFGTRMVLWSIEERVGGVQFNVIGENENEHR